MPSHIKQATNEPAHRVHPEEPEHHNDERQHAAVHPEHQRRPLRVMMIRMRIEARQIRRHVRMAGGAGLHTILGRHQRVADPTAAGCRVHRGSPSTSRLRCSPDSTVRRACSCRTGHTDPRGNSRSDPVPDCGTSPNEDRADRGPRDSRCNWACGESFHPEPTAPSSPPGPLPVPCTLSSRRSSMNR